MPEWRVRLTATAGLGLPAGLAAPLQWAGTVIDLVVAAVVLLDRSGRWATGLQVLVVTGYTLVIGYTTPAA
ncbi:MAG: DoxX-like family protein [Novosphingobium sp.]|nr:DoxX-like family protein [Brevundimonas sp.]